MTPGTCRIFRLFMIVALLSVAEGNRIKSDLRFRNAIKAQTQSLAKVRQPEQESFKARIQPQQALTALLLVLNPSHALNVGQGGAGSLQRSSMVSSYNGVDTWNPDAFLKNSLQQTQVPDDQYATRFGSSDSGSYYDDYWSSLRQRPDQLRAGDLNELLQPDHLQRLRYQVQPLEAYGALFKSDVIVQGLLELNMKSWTEVAESHDLQPPDEDMVMRAMGMRPERAIQSVFMWTKDWGETQKLAFERAELHSKLFQEHEFSAQNGVKQWLTVLNEYGVPCCVCFPLDRESTERMLQQAGILGLFQEIVAADDGCETAMQTYLMACLKLRRPPERCVVFEDEPRGVADAHDALTKVVAVVGTHPGHSLMHADMRIGGLDDMSVYSLREIFKGAPAM